MPLVDADWQRLAQARIAARRDAEGLQYLINTVPASLKGDPGLAFERYLYRVDQGPLAGCRGLHPRGVALGRRARAARHVDGAAGQPRPAGARGRRRRRPPTGSRRGTSAPSGADYADSEWVAGFVALTRLGRPRDRGRALHAASGPRSPPRSASAAPATGSASPTRRRATRPPRRPPSALGAAPDELLRPARRREAGEPAGCPPRRRRRPRRTGATAPFMHVLGGAGRAASCTSPTTSGGPRSSSATPPRTSRPATRAALAQMAIDLGRPADRHPHRQGRRRRRHHHPRPVLPAAPDRRATTWKVPTEYAMASPGRNRSSTPPPPAAPARAA